MQLKIHEVYITAGLGLELGKLKFIKNKINFLKKLQFVKIDDQNAKSVSKSVPNSIPNSVVSLSLKKNKKFTRTSCKTEKYLPNRKSRFM